MKSRYACWFVAAFLTVATASASGTAQEPKKAGPLEQLNDKFREAYRQARTAKLEQAGPIVIVDFDRLTLVRGGFREAVDLDFTQYHRLKAVAHAPFGLYLELAVLPDGPLDKSAQERLVAWRKAIQQAAASLEKLFPDEAQLKRQHDILNECLAFIDVTMQGGAVEQVRVRKFARSIEPTLARNLDEAVRVQIDAYYAQAAKWRKALNADEWHKVQVVVIGAQMPRKDNVAVQFFARWIGETGEGKHLVYAESLYDDAKALNLLGSHLLDRQSGEAFFADPLRLHRDLLGDAAKAYIDTLKFDK